MLPTFIVSLLLLTIGGVAPPPTPVPIGWDVRTGVSLTGTALQKTAAHGDFNNAVAYWSTQVASGNFIVSWHTPATPFDGATCGLKKVSDGVPTTGGGYAQYAYAFNVNDSNLFGASSAVLQAGSFSNTFATPGDDILSLEVVGTTLYWKNGVTTITSATITPEPFYVGCNPYANNGRDFLNTGLLLR